MRILTLLAILLSLMTSLIALPVNQITATQVAAAWYQYHNGTQPVFNSAINTYHNDMYIFTINPRGFIITSTDDRVQPILGYSFEDMININDLPENMEYFLSEYSREITTICNTEAATANIQWQKMLNHDFSDYPIDRPVGPLLTTTWDQGWPYNSLCPAATGGPGNHVYAGCVATTMGQIMKYWAYPTHGTGSHTYTHATYGTLSADFGATTYNYSGMPNYVYSTPNTQISTLLLHCGISVNMDYGPDGSGAQSSAARNSLVGYFLYDPEAILRSKANYTATAWDNMVKADLDLSRPVYYNGQDATQGGHAWVCDGYQGTNYFHMNWGWSGYSNGYYYLANLNPSGYAFNTSQGAILGLHPLPTPLPVTNLSASLMEYTSVILNWSAPQSRALTGYSIYRDNVLLETVTDLVNTSYFDCDVPAGAHSYYIIAEYTQGSAPQSNTVVITVYTTPVANYSNDFETYNDFSTLDLPWTMTDIDYAATQTINGVSFPNQGAPASFIVFNPSATTPPATSINTHSGQKMLASFGSISTPNNDWLFLPLWNSGSSSQLRFWARSVVTNETALSKITVGFSTTVPYYGEVINISGDTPLNVPNQWTQYSYVLSNNHYQPVFVAIHNVSDNGYILLIDDIYLNSNGSANDEHVSTAQGFSMTNYPNPFNPTTTIQFDVKTASQANLEIFNAKGQFVTCLLNEYLAPGTHQKVWNGKDTNGKPVSSGVYYYRLTSGNVTKTAKMLLMK